MCDKAPRREEMGSIVARHHVRGLEQDEPVSLSHSTELSPWSEESVLRTITGVPAPSQHHEPASLPGAGIHNHTFAAERVHDV